MAEQSAAAGDEFLRTRAFDRAAAAYHEAAATVPYNADYSYREAKLQRAVRSPDATREALDAAIRKNPTASNYYLTRRRA